MRPTTFARVVPQDGDDAPVRVDAIEGYSAGPRPLPLLRPLRRAIISTRACLLARQEAAGHWLAEVDELIVAGPDTEASLAAATDVESAASPELHEETALVLHALADSGLDSGWARLSLATTQLVTRLRRLLEADDVVAPLTWVELGLALADRRAILVEHEAAPCLRLHCADEAIVETPLVDRDSILTGLRRRLLMCQRADGGWAPTHDATATSSPEVTGRVLELLGRLGLDLQNAAINQAVDYLRAQQRIDGSWNSCTGVQRLHGTALVLEGLRAVGVSRSDEMITTAASWLIDSQQTCGGWGESPLELIRLGSTPRGPVSVTQTAWATLGLISAGLADHAATVRGVRYLLARQREDGSWPERQFTTVVEPQCRYVRNELHPCCYGLMALSRWASEARGDLPQTMALAMSVTNLAVA